MTIFRPLSHRPFALLWSGQTISRLGDSLYTIALAWFVLEQTGSAAAMGLVLICSTVPMLLFLLLGGVVVDRLPRLRLMLASDLLRGAVVSVMAFLAFQRCRLAGRGAGLCAGRRHQHRGDRAGSAAPIRARSGLARPQPTQGMVGIGRAYSLVDGQTRP